MGPSVLNNNSIKKKTIIDKIVRVVLLSLTILASLIIVFITLFISIKGLSPFFKEYVINGTPTRLNVFDFLFGTTYFVSPNKYGIGFVIINTIYVSIIALIFAIPLSVLSALLIVRKAPKPIKNILKTIIELLSSIPSVIFGMFGKDIITRFVNSLSLLFNYQSKGGLSTLSTSIVLAFMIIPTITLVSITAIESVKNDQIYGSLALGASVTETDFKIVLLGAKNGIISAMILGLGRALGEATAISMVCGNAYKGPNFNLFDTTRTLTSSMLQSIHETSGLDYDIRFSIGLVLIIIIIISNILLNVVKNKIGKVKKNI